MTAPDVQIGPLLDGEARALYEIFALAVGAGEGYPQYAPLTWHDFAELWLGHTTAVLVARLAGAVIGGYYLKPNQPGRGGHIANAGYVVATSARGRGVGRSLVLDSITRAPRYGFDAIQFNFVFASNPARPMYEELGWREIGRVPRAVDDEPAIIYWRDVP